MDRSALSTGKLTYPLDSSSGMQLISPQKVIARKRWSDFHTLTGSLRETIERQGELWLNPQAIRVRVKSRSQPHEPDRNTTVTPGVLSSMSASYRVPFPLSQLLTTTSLDLRSDVFGFLLQVQFSRYLLSLSLFRPRSRSSPPPLALALLEHKLSWIIKYVSISHHGTRVAMLTQPLVQSTSGLLNG